MAKASTKSSGKKKKKVFAGRYRYEKPLGRGAGGSVYLAEDLHHRNRQVALKVLTAEACKTVQGKMLRREFEILSKLDHPNLVEVYDYGSLPDGGVFLAEEYIDGFSLQDARALLEPDALIDVTFQILLGLSYLHGMGMIHRDIKPANVMLLWLDDASARPMVKLVDFGLSSMDPKRDTLRGGTRSYMAPEIIRGEKGELRSDLYSLGVTLYYALCGVLPFGPRSKDDPPPTEEDFRPPEPHRLNEDVPLVLSRFTMALLRQLPDFEYADAGEALQDLVQDTEMLEEWSGGVLANSLDVAAAPVMRGYFERGILRRRKREHSKIVEELVDEEVGQAGQMRLITGAPGVGKSRLMREVAASSKLRGRLVVSETCRAGMRPYELVYLLLSRIVEIGESRNIQQIEHYRSYLLILERMSRLEHRGRDSRVGKHEWVREAFEDAVVMLHPQQVALFVENVHLADRESLDFLDDWFGSSQAFHRPDMVATCRHGEVELELARRDAIMVMQLDGLTRSDIFRFFRERLGIEDIPSDWLADVAEKANGKPAYLEELCRSLIDRSILRRESVSKWVIDEAGLLAFQLPGNVRASFRRRLQAVKASGREALELLTLFDRPVLWENLRELIVDGGESEEVADRTLNGLNWRHLTKMNLGMEGRRISLLEDVLSEVVMDMMASKWKRALHRRIGTYLAENWDAQFATPLEAARHLRDGGLDDDAAELFEIAGDQAWQSSDYGGALECFRAAAALTSGGPSGAFLKMKLSRALLAVYEPSDCRGRLREATEMAERTALDWLIYAVLLTASSISISLGDIEQAEKWLERLRDSLPSTGRQGDVVELEARILARKGKLQDATDKIELCAERARHFGNPEGLITALARLGGLLALRGKTSEARDTFQEALQLASDLDSPVMRGRVLATYGQALRRAGYIDTALEMLSEALEILGNSNYPDAWIRALNEIAICKAHTSDYAEANRYASDALVFARELEEPFLQTLVGFAQSEIDWRESGGAQSALEEMGRRLRRLTELRTDARDVADAWVRYGQVLIQSENSEAESMMKRALSQAKEIGADLLVGRAKKALDANS
jgi:serine/threonine protein kinase/tetratricopeptide (TPR) repeat protein